MTSTVGLAAVLQKRRQEILAKWQKQLAQGSVSAKGRLSNEEVGKQADNFLNILAGTLQIQNTGDIGAAGWQPVRLFLEDLSRQRVNAGFTSDETALFIFSLKRPIFDALREESGSDAGG